VGVPSNYPTDASNSTTASVRYGGSSPASRRS
jgi:hypothetical protein